MPNTGPVWYFCDVLELTVKFQLHIFQVHTDPVEKFTVKHNYMYLSITATPPVKRTDTFLQLAHVDFSAISRSH